MEWRGVQNLFCGVSCLRPACKLLCKADEHRGKTEISIWTGKLAGTLPSCLKWHICVDCKAVVLLVDDKTKPNRPTISHSKYWTNWTESMYNKTKLQPQPFTEPLTLVVGPEVFASHEVLLKRRCWSIVFLFVGLVSVFWSWLWKPG